MFCIEMVKRIRLDKRRVRQGRNAVLIDRRLICVITNVPATTICTVSPTLLLVTVALAIAADARDW